MRDAALEALLVELEAAPPPGGALDAWAARCDRAAGAVDADAEQVVAALDALAAAGDAGGERLDAALEVVDARVDDALEALDAAEDALAAAAGRAREALDAVAALLLAVVGELARRLAEVGEAAEALIAALEREALDEEGARTRDGLAAWLEELDDVVRPGVEAAFSTLGEGLATAGAAGDHGLVALGGATVELVRGFAATATELAEDGAGQVEQLLAEGSRRIGETVLGEVRASAERLAVQGVEVVAVEIAEHASLAAVGASVTTALAPVLPHLAAAKALLTAINQVLEAAGVDDD